MKQTSKKSRKPVKTGSKKSTKNPLKKPFFLSKPEKVVNINSEEYIKPKKNTGKIILSVVLWGMLAFIFILGVVAAARPDPLSDMERRTNSFIAEQAGRVNLSYEVQSFAQNFAKEYLTYQSGRRDDYMNRVRPYISQRVSFSEIQSFRSSAAATYVQAYRLEPYNKDQYDVYVMAEIEYMAAPTMPVSTENQVESSGQAQTRKENTYLKVPVRVLSMGKYIVEDYPVFVANPDGYDFTAEPFQARDADRNINDQIKQVLNNFFTAYYQENQTRIDYFLAADADKSGFKGLDGRYLFKEIKDIRSYGDPTNAKNILSLVEIVIEDHNGTQLTQRFNILIIHDGNRFYILEMGTKTAGIKHNFNGQ
ncbi:MAG: conjugal transfer protein [Oscillospiraceae bacterium]|nr:conjugal transfer protein [Oscillospiraceae bacterium]